MPAYLIVIRNGPIKDQDAYNTYVQMNQANPPKQVIKPLVAYGAVTGLEEVGHGGLHSRGARAGRRVSEGVLRFEHHLKSLANLVQGLDIGRVQMPDDGRGEGAIHPGMDIERTGSHQGSQGDFHAFRCHEELPSLKSELLFAAR